VSFKEIIGQENAVAQLKTAYLRKHISHAYAFLGPSDEGKKKAALNFVKLFYRYSSDGGSTWTGFSQYGGTYPATPIPVSFTGSAYGEYQFYTIAQDNAGNIEDAPPGATDEP